MLIERGIGDVIEQSGGDILFPMNDGWQRVPCTVTAEALDHLTNGRFRTPRSAFDSVRLRIESIASTKYHKGFLEEDGSVSVKRGDLGSGVIPRSPMKWPRRGD
jgi:Protein of unknown function (DUF1488)